MIENNLAGSVNDEIYKCLNLDNPKSFFLFAGAGSGKTGSLVKVLKEIRKNNFHRLELNGQKVAIITYTNAACDEIKHRLDFDHMFTVLTIHSFSWELIKPYQCNIRSWLKQQLKLEIAELEEAQIKGRAGTKAAEDRPRQIITKQTRLDSLDKITKFVYNPNGNNSSRDSLNHAEVISLTVDFLLKKPLLGKILVNTYPILLIDESQDTKKELIEAFFEIQQVHSKCFVLGLFGDNMQRIYSEGKKDLGENLPSDWAKPITSINHRCPKRIITLINKIRADVDRHNQQPGLKNEDGFVRLFVADLKNTFNKTEFEIAVSSKMAEITGDINWSVEKKGAKVLTLEHHMAANRGGFGVFFNPLYAIDKFKTGLLDGKLSGVSLFANQILPLVKAMKIGDKFTVARIVKEHSPLLKRENLKISKTPREDIIKANEAVKELYALWGNGSSPLLKDIIKKVHSSDLFQVPEILLPIVTRLSNHLENSPDTSNSKFDKDEAIDAWDEALMSSINQFEEYFNYISDNSHFGTHQGIKGLEFPRVMVVLDDEEARGFLFSYEKLFGAKEPTTTDRKNETEGKETSIERTRRLFYVTCSRAKKSLAIVVYTTAPEKVKNHVVQNGWFDQSEIVSDLII